MRQGSSIEAGKKVVLCTRRVPLASCSSQVYASDAKLLSGGEANGPQLLQYQESGPATRRENATCGTTTWRVQLDLPCDGCLRLMLTCKQYDLAGLHQKCRLRSHLVLEDWFGNSAPSAQRQNSNRPLKRELSAGHRSIGVKRLWSALPVCLRSVPASNVRACAWPQLCVVRFLSFVLQHEGSWRTS